MAQVPKPTSAQPPEAKDFDFESFFTNRIVMEFISGLVNSLLSIFKGKAVTPELEREVKSKAFTVLKNLDQFTNPNFSQGIADKITKDITGKLDQVIEAINNNTVQPDAIKSVVKESVAQGFIDGAPMAILEAMQKVEAKSVTKYVPREDGL